MCPLSDGQCVLKTLLEPLLAIAGPAVFGLEVGAPPAIHKQGNFI